MHEILREAGNAGELLSRVNGEDGSAQALAILVMVNRMLDEKATIVDRVPGKAVEQTHLESGDIELF